MDEPTRWDAWERCLFLEASNFEAPFVMMDFWSTLRRLSHNLMLGNKPAMTLRSGQLKRDSECLLLLPL